MYYAGAGEENKRATNFVGAKEKLHGDAIFVLATHGFHLFNMLRPEWVRESKIPLSSGTYYLLQGGV